jgi:ubiquinone/menaquinone biosynthesis C-methylase UbiE
MSQDQNYYDKDHIDFLEKLWGDGYLSPGGVDEVKRIFGKTETLNKTILDIGCGSGGIAVSMVKDYGVKKVIGIDVESAVCDAAIARVKKMGLEEKVEIKKVNTGPLIFIDSSFDIVFSKDSIVHIEEKESLIKEIFRILKPGGFFLASDWLSSHDGEPSPEMAYYLELEDLGFDMASPDRYERALKQAGFKNIILENRNKWYTVQARQEVDTLSKSRREEFEEISSAKYMDLSIETWNAMISVLQTGEHCPHHIKAMKPN